MSENKYFNADTSPERLAEIAGIFHKIEPRMRDVMNNPDSIFPAMRDLLAMLQVRDSTIAYDRQILHATEDRLRDERAVLDELQRDIKDMSQQLHDQRWRRLSDEKPLQGFEYIELSWMAGPFQAAEIGSWQGEHGFVFKGDRLRDMRHYEMWWRPIPPLPKE